MNHIHWVACGIVCLAVCGTVLTVSLRPSAPAKTFHEPTAADLAVLREKANTALRGFEDIEGLARQHLDRLQAEQAIDVLSAIEELRLSMRSFRALTEEVAAGRCDQFTGTKIERENAEFQRLCTKVQKELAAHEGRQVERFRQNAEAFDFAGIGFASTLADCRRRYPAETPFQGEVDRICGVASIGVLHPASATYAQFKFFDEQLYSLWFSYDWNAAGELGGFTGIESRLISKLGPPHERDNPLDPKSTIRRTWTFPERTIELTYSDSVRVEVTHVTRDRMRRERETEYYTLMNRARQKRNAGF